MKCWSFAIRNSLAVKIVIMFLGWIRPIGTQRKWRGLGPWMIYYLYNLRSPQSLSEEMKVGIGNVHWGCGCKSDDTWFAALVLKVRALEVHFLWILPLWASASILFTAINFLFFEDSTVWLNWPNSCLPGPFGSRQCHGRSGFTTSACTVACRATYGCCC